jgi:hypothetical protein
MIVALIPFLVISFSSSSFSFENPFFISHSLIFGFLEHFYYALVEKVDLDFKDVFSIMISAYFLF